ncbi:nitric oxide reductase activation protein NorD [Mycolicibacterium parafortuitum]|uniref:Dinitrification protein NorD [Rhodopseudomonas palustris CGA009] n=1 Tax=Mycolicibacterium parafortuitum TaxID=39692 RepID=A0A375YS69_MYCPF|nr:VWA domain-containing protein [Mycolicibacterium parafortuitum]ORB29003.1 MorD protein [Mycolicibacterium parafortuitum]SRX83920.1 dinitrification protein NorD [Rhodopseudomonas palustris CGA009] [Mycolicibacterium parafortuitum]
MSELSDAHAMAIERSCALTAVALSRQRRTGAHLVTGQQRGFGLSSMLDVVHVPYPARAQHWNRRTLTCGIALQCAPSKDRVTDYRLNELSARELTALHLVEAGVALGWIATTWPGLLPEFARVLPDLTPADADMDGRTMLDRAIALARTGLDLTIDPLIGRLPRAYTVPQGLTDKLRRSFGRLPWTTSQKRVPQPHSVPAGGDGGVRNPNLPPPSRPQDNDLDITPEHRPGIPYPEWNAWTESFMPDHVAVLERTHEGRAGDTAAVAVDVRRWFEKDTHRAMKNRLEDGSDLDVDQYVGHYIDVTAGEAVEPRIFRELLPASRDVTSALLLDGSSSLGVHGGTIFKLELACADALSRAMTSARERHGIFVFTGNTRHRVEVTCLKDFSDRRFVPPGSLGLATGGYTRLGAPLRHLTSRLLAQPSERRLLIVIGDGLISDEGYEGRYAWADAAHAVEEARDAGVSMYYVGIGPVRVDPLPEVFGPKRSQRIRRIEDLPRVLAHVHKELVAA